MTDISRRAKIIGFGDSYAADSAQKTPVALAVEAAAAAINDAGLTKDTVSGLLTGRPPLADPRPQWNNILASQLSLAPIHSTEITTHGAGLVGMLKHAALAVTSGITDVVLCVYSDSAPLFVDAVSAVPDLDADPVYERPYGPSIPSLYALWARRDMHENGYTERDLARVSVSAQEWGRHHPYAAKRRYGQISVEDVLASPIIASPLRRWNCATWGPDGTGGAFIVVADDYTPPRPDDILIAGFGECSTHEYLSERMGLVDGDPRLGALPNLTRTGSAVAADDAFNMADLRPDDLDFVPRQDLGRVLTV